MNLKTLLLPWLRIRELEAKLEKAAEDTQDAMGWAERLQAQQVSDFQFSHAGIQLTRQRREIEDLEHEKYILQSTLDYIMEKGDLDRPMPIHLARKVIAYFDRTDGWLPDDSDEYDWQECWAAVLNGASASDWDRDHG